MSRSGSEPRKRDERHRVGGGDPRPDAVAILESLSNPFYSLDAEGRLTFVSRGAERMWGKRRAELIGERLLDVFPQVDGSESWAAHQRAMAEQRSITYETISPILGIWIQATVNPVPGGGLAVYFQDISERKRLEEQTRFLAQAGEVLGSSLDYRQTLRRVARLAVSAVADWCAVSIMDDQGQLSDIEVVHSDPAREALAKELLLRYPPDPSAPGGLYQVVRTGEPELIPEIMDEFLRASARDADHLRTLRQLNLRSALTAPLAARGRIFGTISLISDSERRFSTRDLEFVTDLARRAGLAIDNARVYERAQAAEHRSAFLARATAILSSSLDYQTTIRAAASLAVPEIADWCVVDVIEENGGHEIRRVAATHRDKSKDELLNRLKHLYPVDRDSRMPDAQAARTRQPILWSTVDHHKLAEVVRDREQLRILKLLGTGSVLSVPLLMRDEPLGALTLVRTESREGFVQDDVELAMELARRAANAVDNARLFEAAMIANRARTDFLAVMSHELRTPLNAIIGYADLLGAGILGSLPQNQMQPVQRIRASALHLLTLIEEILAFTRLEAGRESVRLELVDLAGVARETFEEIKPLALAKGLAPELELPNQRLTGETDPGKLRRILHSLLSNAVRFTDSGTIRLELSASNGTAMFRVQDTGIGISSKHLDKIYEPFWQEAPPLTRETGGAGLGLPVAYRLAHRLGGELSVDSEIGRGSTFELRIPLHPLIRRSSGGAAAAAD